MLTPTPKHASDRAAAAATPSSPPPDDDDFFPLVHLPPGAESSSSVPPVAASAAIVRALKNSGFLLLTTPLVPPDLQRRALDAAAAFLRSEEEDSNGGVVVVSHPSDPKRYCMLERHDIEGLLRREDSEHDDEAGDRDIESLGEYFDAVERAKVAVLRCLASGLGLDDPAHFADLHSECNSTLRLLHYPPLPSSSSSRAHLAGNRCKEHSDYGTVTLLLVDGVSGLEALQHHDGDGDGDDDDDGAGAADGRWLPVPYVEGALVVNVGSLLSEWTGGALRATLHRVAGPASIGSDERSRARLLEAAGRARTSVAFFADPDRDVKARLDTADNDGGGESDGGEGRGMSVAEYIRFRSGGSDADGGREGVAFTEEEEVRVKGDV